MLRKNRFLTLSAIVAALMLTLQCSANAFEIFPRPEDQYTVQRGQNLHGLAGFYYGNPTLWPFLWNQNPSVFMKEGTSAPDQQLLPPGSKINLYHKRFPFGAMNQTYNRPTGVPEEFTYVVHKVPLQGIPYDKKYFRYKLSSRPIQLWGYVVSSPDETKTWFLERDLVYIRLRPGKKQAVLVGDRLGIYRDSGPLRHPINPERPIGYMTQLVGEVEIISTGHDLVTAIVLESYVELNRGDKVCLYTPRDRQIVPTKTHRLLTGTILSMASRDFGTLIVPGGLENDVVFVDRGECDGMKEGMLLNIYRAATPVEDPYFRNRRLATPDAFVGEGLVLKAFDKNSTVLITRSREEVWPGNIIKTVSD
jgi:hypothetical protein